MSMKEYKVIEIINKYALIINCGLKDKITKGTELMIVEKGEPVIDPSTQEILGTLDIYKETVEVYQVYENFSVCKKFRTVTTNILSPLANLGKVTNTSSEELNVDTSDFTNKKYRTEDPIKVGDNAITLY